MDRLNHHHLYIFWVLAKQGTFTRAAQELRIAQSAVTAQIKQLEDALGMTLIDRSNRRRPELTNEGKRVLDFADSIFETSSELMKWAKHGEPSKTQTLRVGALSGLSRNLQYEFLKPLGGHPAVKLEVTTGDQEKLVRLLREHALDIILSSHNVKLEGKVSFYSHVLTRSPVVFVLPIQDKKRGARLSDYLSERPLYIPGQAFETRPELDAHIERLKCPVRIAGEIDDIALLRIFALRSGAVVAVPQMGVQDDLTSKALFAIGKATSVEQRFYAITRQKKFTNSLVEQLIEGLRR